ncbi:MAG: DUF1330 domain-containing protein [Burkholderiales bacterium]|nr:DUF1330 domain-containing protein [Burkholderiales bacterium]
MPAYVIAEVEVIDRDAYEDYRGRVPATLAAYGGRFIVRGGTSETLEGAWSPQRVVVIEFPDRASAKAWWASEQYAGAKALRQRSARTELIVVDGV